MTLEQIKTSFIDMLIQLKLMMKKEQNLKTRLKQQIEQILSNQTKILLIILKHRSQSKREVLFDLYSHKEKKLNLARFFNSLSLVKALNRLWKELDLRMKRVRKMQSI